MFNWRASWPDHVQEFSFKRTTHLHTGLQKFPQEGVRSGNVPDWRTKGKTEFVQKDPAKCTEISNYHPIACLPIMWRLLTGIIGERLYLHLERSGLLTNEQKGCRKWSCGT